ncbi:hypothetical protein FQ330_00575 [Agrococcus sediminis]|uniref:DUF3320 domain-containing protein n=1 Tax=Agrococcus sediminis TaxID=2599924 RepID=A0A5M8QLY1_9MICO|nr:hypothetical protein [Agrococcus sediminis]KAA6435964.1 hypothetical protein FQ330_00575 [Agrococcus sediminis]
MVRNGWARGREFDVKETWRALDYGVRLLDTLGDTHGADVLALQRDRWWGGCDVEPATVDRVTTPIRLDVTGDSDELTHPARPGPAPRFAVSPASSQDAAAAADTILTGGGEPLPYEPWAVVEVGDPSVLDSLRHRASKEAVRAVIGEIVEFEGPTSLRRLVWLVARSFGVRRLHRDRERQLEHQVKQSGVAVDADSFVWPSTLNREAWSGYRPTPPGVDRPLPDVSPLEIANVVRYLAKSASASDMESAMLSTFRVKRRGQQVAAQLDRAKALLES